MDNIERDRIKKKRGRKGEDLACEFLRQNGYRVIERNFRCKMGEIDIVATDGEHICSKPAPGRITACPETRWTAGNSRNSCAARSCI